MLSFHFLGLLFGWVLLLAAGPNFFGLIQTVIQQGIQKGLLFVLGTALIDWLFVTLALNGLSDLLSHPSILYGSHWFAMILLASAGGYFLWKKPPVVSERVDKAAKWSSGIKYFFKGVFLNLFNPFILIFWVSMVAIATNKFHLEAHQKWFFFSGVLTTSLCLDITKTLLAHKLKAFFTPKMLGWLNKILGATLLLVSLRVGYQILSA